ncbi:hypothetical protein SAMN02910317_01281 [Ruminococcaceae bacterium FB2012]|nr:hypothetical protein SAMN02910317_01281 [Ruminococcaceae bacterium FB2012]
MNTFIGTITVDGCDQETIIRAENQKAITDHYGSDCKRIITADRKAIENAFREFYPVVTIGSATVPETAKAKEIKETISDIKEIIREAMYMKNAYFFSPPNRANDRRRYEERHSHDTVTWSESGSTYSACFDVTCTCRYVYAKGYYAKDGYTTTLKAIRYSVARLETALLLGEI